MQLHEEEDEGGEHEQHQTNNLLLLIIFTAGKQHELKLKTPTRAAKRPQDVLQASGVNSAAEEPKLKHEWHGSRKVCFNSAAGADP
jgi:hypothetical protein